MNFELYSDYSPAGDQPQAIEKLVDGLTAGLAHQTLLGVTGSGKTFTIANVIQQVQRPTLVLAHNKTLAAQLYGEFKVFFPKNSVEYFVSYYDYYQPEAYVPASDTFIEKDASINEHIEQMRLSATKALLERPDCIIVATVSAIYGLGDPQAYLSMVLHMSRGDRLEQRKLLRRLADMQYTRNEIDLQQGTYRVRGDVIDIFPAESEREAVRVELFDYLPKDALLVIDESHQTIPQLGAMYKGDRSRKETLVEYGFRLPSALDNRPLRFEEFEQMAPQAIYVSATPSHYEKRVSAQVIEQVVRPTGLIDPAVEIRPVRAQVDDLLSEIRLRAQANERVLVTTLTKRMAEDLTEYLNEHVVKVRYLHSDIETVERSEIIRDLRLGKFDVIVGINLLREGLDMPEVSLVAILDADKEGFLRSEGSLIQTIGRAARNVQGKAILYADVRTGSIERAVAETDRRRNKQIEFNAAHGITPRTIVKAVADVMEGARSVQERERLGADDDALTLAPEQALKRIKKLEADMMKLARNLEFEQAARLRDQIQKLRHAAFGVPDTRAG